MKLYVSIKGEWAAEFHFWLPHDGLLYVMLDDLPLAVEEGRRVGLTYVDLWGHVEHGAGRIETVALHRGEFQVGISTDFDPGGESA